MERTILPSPTNASFHLRSPDGSLYTIEISKVPKCDCPYSSAKKGTVCKHRIFILVEKCGVDFNKVVDRKFGFCTNSFCIAVPPANSNLIAPPDIVMIDTSVEIQSDDIATVRRSGVNLIWSTDC